MVDYAVKNDEHSLVIGTSLCGHITKSFSGLCKILGPPGEGEGDRVDAEWVLEFIDGVVATIYNYKDGYNYLGKEGIPIEDIIDWHIGGNHRLAHYHVEGIFKDLIMPLKKKDLIKVYRFIRV